MFRMADSFKATSLTKSTYHLYILILCMILAAGCVPPEPPSVFGKPGIQLTFPTMGSAKRIDTTFVDCDLGFQMTSTGELSYSSPKKYVIEIYLILTNDDKFDAFEINPHGLRVTMDTIHLIPERADLVKQSGNARHYLFRFITPFDENETFRASMKKPTEVHFSFKEMIRFNGKPIITDPVLALDSKTRYW